MLSERSGQENTGAFLNQSLGDRTGKKRDRTEKSDTLYDPSTRNYDVSISNEPQLSLEILE
jgi:hypothetical protein